MNKTNKKFKTLLTNEYNRLAKFFENHCVQHCLENFKDEIFNPLTKPSMDPVALYNSLSNNIDYAYQNEVNKFNQIVDVLNFYNSEVPIYNFSSVKKLLNIYNYNQKEQAEVLAYFLNKNLKIMLSYDIDNDEYLKKDFGICVEDQRTKEIKPLSNCAEEIKLRVKELELLRNIITETGDIIPYENTEEIITIINKGTTTLLAEPEHVIMVLNESKRKFEKQQSKKTEYKQPVTMHKEVSYEDEVKACKIQKQTVQELKNYLDNNIPIKFITDEDLIVINNALDILNYSTEQKDIIRKNIKLNNKRIEEELKEQKFNEAKESLLGNFEYEILEQSENIINDENALKNPFYFAICENYNQIKEKLLQALDLKNNIETETDEYELIIIETMCIIDDLGNSIENYNYSNFKRVPKKDNN